MVAVLTGYVVVTAVLGLLLAVVVLVQAVATRVRRVRWRRRVPSVAHVARGPRRA